MASDADCDLAVRHERRAAEIAALNFLARREHSAVEMRRKLLRRGHSRQVVDFVIEQLAARQLISDVRFAGSMLRSRSGRGQGPVRIRAELRQQGIDTELVQAEFDRAECDWTQLATQARIRKFGSRLPQGSAERAKQARFLQYRGFTADQIRAALGSDADSDGSGMDADFRSDPEPDC